MKRTETAGVLVAAVVLALLTTWALGPGLLDGTLVGGGEQPDSTGSLWAMWWLGEAISDGKVPWTASANAFPIGQSPVGYYNLMEAALGAPLVRLLGPAPGYNATCALILWSTGLAAVTAARWAGAGWPGALASGVAVMLSPWVVLELTSGRLAQAWAAAPILALGLFSRLRDGRGGTLMGAAAGALLALSALTYWFHGLFVVLGISALWGAPAQTPRRHSIRGLVAAAVTCGAFCGAPTLALATGLDGLPGMERALPDALDHGPRGRGLFSLNMAIARSPGVLWPLWSPDWEPTDLRLPVTLLGLALAGAISSRGQGPRARWVVVAGLGWVLTLGPWLRGAGGEPLPIPLPWLALHDLLPGFSRMWWPVRASVLVVPALALLAARGIDGIANSLPRARPWARSALALLLLAEIGLRAAYLPLPRGPGRPVESRLYEQLDGALVTTPVLGRSADARHLLWLQAHHGLPILAALGDHLPAHVSPAQSAYVAQNALLRQLHAVAGDRTGEARVEPGDVSALLDAGFRWVVVDPTAYPPRTADAWARQHRAVLDAVFGPPSLSSGPVAAWRIEAPAATVVLPALQAVEPGLTPDLGIPVRIRRDVQEPRRGPPRTPTLRMPTAPRSP